MKWQKRNRGIFFLTDPTLLHRYRLQPRRTPPFSSKGITMNILAILSCVLLIACSKDQSPPVGPASKATSTVDALQAPTNLRIEAITDTSAKVAWDAVEGATDYDLNYRTLPGRWTNEPHRGTRLWNIIYDLEPNTEYRWAVRAENRAGASAWVHGENFTTWLDLVDTTSTQPDQATPSIQGDVLGGTLRTSPPTWIFAGDIPPDKQVALQEEMEHVRAFFANQYDVEATGFTVVVSKDYKSFGLAMEKLTGWRPYREHIGIPLAEGYVTPSTKGGAVVGLLYGEHPKADYFSSVKSYIVHEYFHVLQGQLATRFAPLENDEIAWRMDGPSWLIEGLASYADYVYTPSRPDRRAFLGDRYTPYEDLKIEEDLAIEGLLGAHALGAMVDQSTFSCGLNQGFSTWYAYALSFVASIFLSQQAEENSYVEYWRFLYDRPWQMAFEDAFGTSVESFQNAFYAWYPSLSSDLPEHIEIGIQIRWPDTKISEQTSLELDIEPEGGRAYLRKTTFEVREYSTSSEVRYVYELGDDWTSYLGCWITDNEDAKSYFLGWYKNGELTDQREEATLVEFSGTSPSSLEWILPAHPATLPRLKSRSY